MSNLSDILYNPVLKSQYQHLVSQGEESRDYRSCAQDVYHSPRYAARRAAFPLAGYCFRLLLFQLKNTTTALTSKTVAARCVSPFI